MTKRSRAPRQKAYCTFCEKVRALLASGHPVRHNAHLQQSLCNGCRHEAQKCKTCDGKTTVRRLAYDITCSTCKGTGKVIK